MPNTRKKKLARTQTRRKQRGGSAITNSNKLTGLLAGINNSPGLLAGIKRALNSPGPGDLSRIQSSYKTMASNQLYDLIYAQTSVSVFRQDGKLTSPALIWDHGVNQPASITAGKPGIHIYIMLDSKTGKYILVGVFNRPEPNN
jgi:hypothetical protein